MVGGVDYESGAKRNAHETRGETPRRRWTPECEDFTSLQFDELSASEVEVREIASIWKSSAARRGDERAHEKNTVRLTGSKASEPAFRRTAPGKRIIHLATHGFFIGTGCPRGAEAQGSVAAEGAWLEGGASDPLLRSGLALAGANKRQGPSPEDGILTAQEVAGLDLSEAEWVVLSGCDTGVGAILDGEGVLGLSRAFQIAGAGTLVLSLWKVEDDVTRSWMRELYESRFREVSTRPNPCRPPRAPGSRRSGRTARARIRPRGAASSRPGIGGDRALGSV